MLGGTAPDRSRNKSLKKSPRTCEHELDDGWPESETCDCPALSKRYIEREKETVDVKE